MDDCLHRWKLGFDQLSLTMRTGLAGHTTLHTFGLACFLWHALVLFGFPR